jgi:hypothetical protein
VCAKKRSSSVRERGWCADDARNHKHQKGDKTWDPALTDERHMKPPVIFTIVFAPGQGPQVAAADTEDDATDGGC